MKVTDRRTFADGRLEVTVFGLGCAALAGLFEAVPEPEARATLDAAWDAGLRYFDTAPFYGYTRGERRVGAALVRRPRGELVLSTKVGRLMEPDDGVAAGSDGWADPLPWRPRFDYTYDGVMRSLEQSLHRLGLERVDILLVHDIGRLTHGERHDLHWAQLTRGGGLRALEELRRDGRIAAFGLGVNEFDVVRDAMQEARLDCTLLAGRHTLLEQRALDFLDACARDGNAIIIGGPFNSGVLAGDPKFDYGAAPPDVVRRAQALADACAEFDVPLQAAALQFPTAHPAVVSCVAGARTAAQLRQNVRWFEQEIPPALWAALRTRGLLDERAPCPGDPGARS
ncbi:MAG TPA: aldo/keto reductase [Burkholderiaceae bacterium]